MRIPELRALEQNRTDPRNPSKRRCCSAPLKLSGPRKCETRHPEGWRVTRNSDEFQAILEDAEDGVEHLLHTVEQGAEDAVRGEEASGQVGENVEHIDVPFDRGS